MIGDDIMPRGDDVNIFPHIFSRGVVFPLHHMVIWSLSGPLTFQFRDICISTFLDHLLHMPSKWPDVQDILRFSTVYDLTGALMLTLSCIQWLCRLTNSRGS